MQVTDLSLDFDALFSKRRTMVEETADIAPADLRDLTVELYDHFERLTDGVTDADVVFVAADPAEDGAPG